MAKKSSRTFAGMGKIKGSSTEVNPTFSLKKAPRAVPTNGGKQVNPTVAANKSQSAVSKIQKTRVNPTFAVTHASAETSKGKSGRVFVAAKQRTGSPIAKKSNPMKPNVGNTKKAFKTPTRNIPGGIGRGKRTNGPAKTHSLSGAKDTEVPTRNEMAPFGMNGGATNKQITTARLKKLGF